MTPPTLHPRHRGLVERAKRWGFLTVHKNTPKAAEWAYEGWCADAGRPAISAIIDRRADLARVVVTLPDGELFDDAFRAAHPAVGDPDAWWASDGTWWGSWHLTAAEARTLAWRAAEWWAGRRAEEGGE